MRQTLSRELERYRSPSPAAVAAKQLAEAGKPLRPGQSVRLVFTLGKPAVRAWDLDGAIDPRTVNVKEYRKLLLRAADTILASVQAKAEEPYTLPLFPQVNNPTTSIPVYRDSE